MNISTAVRHATEHVRTVGIAETARWMLRRIQWRVLERRYRIRTEGIIPMSALGLENGEALDYVATDYSDFSRMMRALQVDPAEHAFVDFGAGLGRVVILAATYPFRRVIGVEHSPALAGRARDNVEHSRPRLACQSVDIVVSDAAAFVLPSDASVFFFNNPFQGQVLEAVLANIRELARRAHRPLLLVCNLPAVCQFEAQIRRQAWLRLRRALPLAEERHCLIFETSRDAL
jgi:hypothetical protein